MNNSDKSSIEIEYPKGEETYLFIFDEARRDEFLDQLNAFACDSALSFDENDAGHVRWAAGCFEADPPTL